jgi:fatty acid desaturase
MNFSVPESAFTELPTGHAVLANASLKELNTRSTEKGLFRLADHFLIMGISGYAWSSNLGHNWAIAIPALLVYGFSLAAMFAPLHECSHRTAFAHNILNDTVGWLAGLLSFYNIAYFRHYHKWHHRYTLDPEKDPERRDPALHTRGDYFLHISGLPWWRDKLLTHFRVACGQLKTDPFIPHTAHRAVVRSTQLQLAIYALAILISVIDQQPWFIWYWLLPLAVGQPLLRCMLLAEHTGCSEVRNPFTNTRSTITRWPVRFLMWNMPFHAEHHLYPSIPFYHLPIAHQQLQQYFTYIQPGYLQFNRDLITGLDSTS